MDATDRRRRTILIAAITGGLIVLLLVGVGVYGLIRGPQLAGHTPTASTNETDTTAPRTEPSSGPVPVEAVNAPEEFAVAVAEALFTWNTTSGYGPADYAQVLADVTASREADAAAADVRAYLPTPAAWAQLRTHHTRQSLTIDASEIPAAWDPAVAQAAPGQIPDGAIAYTITGTRLRDGFWGTEPVTTVHPVAFTVFLTCAADSPAEEPPRDAAPEHCLLLRLSQLDTPLR